MAGRPKKQTVDYFPHYCRHGKTMMILEQKYGNDGYAFWFKLLELLGDTEGHQLDLNDPIAWEFLQSKSRLPEETCTEILNLLSKLKAIDPDLWKNQIIWCDNFVQGISDAYRNRVEDTPEKPEFKRKKLPDGDISDVRNTHSRVEERKEKKRKDIAKTPIPSDFKISDGVLAWAKKNNQNHLNDHLEAFIDICLSNGYKAIDWDCKFKRAIRENWGKIDLSKPEPPKARQACPCGSGMWADKCNQCGGGKDATARV